MRNDQANMEITNSLHEQQLNQQNSQFYANQDLEAQRLAASSGYQQGQLANQQQQTKQQGQQISQQGQYQQGSLAVQQQTAQTQADREAAYEEAVKGQAAKNQGMGDYYKNKADNIDITRPSPYAPGNHTFDAAEKTITMLQRQLQLAQAAQHSKEIYGSPVNANDPGYQQAVAQTKDLQQKLNMLTQAHMNSMQEGQKQAPLLPGPQGGAAPAPTAPVVAPQVQQQPAGAGQGGRGPTVNIGTSIIPFPAPPQNLLPPTQGAAIAQYPDAQQQLVKLYGDKASPMIARLPQNQRAQAFNSGFAQYVQQLGWR